MKSLKNTMKAKPKLILPCGQCGKEHSTRVPCCFAKEKPFKLTAPKKPSKYEKEWQSQRKLFDYAKAHEAEDPRWKLLNGSMNGLRSTPAAVVMAKLCGLKPGYPDTNWPIVGYAGCPGLYVEVKRKHPKWETCGWDCATDDQRWWRDALRGQGYQVEVAHGHEELIAFYEAYIRDG